MWLPLLSTAHIGASAMTPPSAEPTPCSDPGCPDHPLADIHRLTKWHEDQHPELGFLWGVEKERAQLIAQVEALEAENERLREVLKEITKGEGRFSRDHLTHCENTVEDMKELAREGLEQPHD